MCYLAARTELRVPILRLAVFFAVARLVLAVLLFTIVDILPEPVLSQIERITSEIYERYYPTSRSRDGHIARELLPASGVVGARGSTLHVLRNKSEFICYRTKCSFVR